MLRHFTQNIDTLERVAGMSADVLVEAHGSFGEAQCVDCDMEYPSTYIEQHIFAGELSHTYTHNLFHARVAVAVWSIDSAHRQKSLPCRAARAV